MCETKHPLSLHILKHCNPQKIIAWIVATTVLTNSVTLFGQQAVEPPDSTHAYVLENAQRQLGIRLINPAVRQGNNFVCSPHDVYLSLTLLALASEGSSKLELLSALSANSLNELKAELNEGQQIGLPTRFTLGALLKPDEQMRGLIINSKPGPESALAQAGFREKDLITHANGVPLKSFQQISQIVSLTCGRLTLIGIHSEDGKSIEANVQLGVHRQLVPIIEKPFVSSRVLLTSPQVNPTQDFMEQAKGLVTLHWVQNAFAEEGPWRADVQKYVEQHSGGRVDAVSILDALPANQEEVDFVIASSGSYQEMWQRPFTKKRNKEPFHTVDGPKNVDMMIRSGQFNYSQQEDAHVVEIPFESCLNRVRIWLPKPNTDLSKVLLRLSATNASDNLVNSLERRPLQLTMPRFRLKSDFTAERLASTLNLNRIFSDKADLPGLSSDSKIGDIAQDTEFECREDGVRAKSTTRVVGIPKGGIPDLLELTVNRPFYFELIEASGAILFSGVVNSPEYETVPQDRPQIAPMPKEAPIENQRIQPQDPNLPTGSVDV